MANIIEIIISAIDNASGSVEKVKGSLSDLKDSQSSATGVTQAATAASGQEAVAVGGLASTLEVAAAATAAVIVATAAVGAAMMAAGNQTLAYTKGIRDISLLSGQSAEATSRMMYVMSNYGVTTADLEMATRKLTAQGLVPNIQTLAQLSDQYLALGTQQEKNLFLQDNFGRTSQNMVLVMQLGSAAILNQSAAMSQLAVTSTQDVAALTKNEMAHDALNVAVGALTHTIGNVAIPVMTTFTLGLAVIATTLLNVGSDAIATADNIKTFVAALLGIKSPPPVVITADTSEAEAKVQQLRSEIAGLSAAKGTWTSPGVFNGNVNVIYGPGGSNPVYWRGHAAGGFGGGMSTINELGPENVFLPQGAYVSTAAESARASGGAQPMIFNFPNYLGSKADLEQYMRSVVRQMQVEGSAH